MAPEGLLAKPEMVLIHILVDRIESTVVDRLCEALVCLMIIERFERELCDGQRGH